MGLLNLDDYISTIKQKIESKQDLCKLIYYDDDEPLSQTDLTDTTILTDRDSQYRRVYFVPFDPNIHATQQTTIHVELSDSEVSRDTFYKTLDISFIILTHNHMWELYTSDGSISLRPNKILTELVELFNCQQSIGVGHPYFSKLENIYLNEKVAGYKVTFKNVDFTENT